MATSRAPRPRRSAVAAASGGVAATDPKPAPRAPASSFADDEPPRPEDAVEVARVLGAWGIKGALRLKAFSADPQALFSSKRWWLEPAAASPGPRAQAPQPRLLHVVQAREHGDAIVATTHELQDRDAAEALKGARVFVSRASFPTPDEGEFYWVDLIGLTVRNRQGVVLGLVDHLVETGPHCVLCVRPAGDATAEEVMIPFVDAYVDRVDREARLIEVDWQPDY